MGKSLKNQMMMDFLISDVAPLAEIFISFLGYRLKAGHAH